MIEFKNLNKEEPYVLFKAKYDEALNADQKNIEAIAISSFDSEKKEVDSRYVKLKMKIGFFSQIIKALKLTSLKEIKKFLF